LRYLETEKQNLMRNSGLRVEEEFAMAYGWEWKNEAGLWVYI
jgi:hypothetical protein